MILSFSDKLTEKIYHAPESLTRKEIRALGQLNLDKAYARLQILHRSTEKDLLGLQSLTYHSLNNGRYSIDADSRRSPWRITFQWNDEELHDVRLVKIEDTHESQPRPKK